MKTKRVAYFYNTMNRKKFILFRLSLIFIVVFSSITNSSLNEQKSYNEQNPKVAESYWIKENWNRTWDSGNVDAADDMEIGASNNILITGSIDNGRLIFIIKFNSSGNQMWNKTWGGYAPDNNYGFGIAEDSDGNVYVCGKDILLKYDTLGNFIWNVTLKSAVGYDIAIDNSNNIYIVGSTYYDFYIKPDFFFMKLNSSGDQIWNQTWGYTGKIDKLEKVLIDSNNDIIVGGEFYYESPITNWRTILIKYNSSGVKLWQQILGSIGSTAYEFRDLIFDSSDNIFICFRSSHRTAWIYMYDSTGSRIRYDNLDQDGASVSNCYLHLDLNGYLYVFATTGSRTTIYKLNTLLRREWKSSWIYDEYDSQYAVEFGGDSNDNIYTALVGSPNWDVIIAKFNTAPPLNPSIIINNGENITYSNKVSLTLSAKGAEEISFRNGTMGDWTNWESYNSVKELYLEGSVNNTDYNISVKFRNVIGESQVVSDNITYITYDLIIEPNLDNFSINIGDTGFLLSWYAKNFGRMNDSYWITRNQTLIFQGQWQHNTNITYYEMEALQGGLYNYTCFINDTIGNIVYSSIFVKVNLNPYIANIKFPENNIYSPNAEYTFNCSWFDDDGTIQKVKFEFNNKNYTVLTNHSGEFSYTLSNLPANESGYKFRWHGLDNNGAWNSTKLFTYVLHKNKTQLEILFNGSSGNKYDLNINYINITIINLNSTPGKLQLLINSLLMQENNDHSLSYITKFVKGVYNITALLIHENYTGTSFNFLHIIKPPYFINQSEDFTMIEGEVFREIYWEPYNENNSFWILRNGTEIYNGTWSGPLIKFYDLYLLSPGYYNFTCFINNTYGFKNSSSIFIKIILNHYPNITNTTNNITVNIGAVGYSLSWHVYDLDGNTDSYWIERNFVRIDEGTWNNDTDIIYIELNILDVGIYNYTCFVNDSLGLVSQSSILIKINSFPQYSGIILPSIDTYTPNLDYIFNCSWFDIDGIINEVKIEFDYQNYTVIDNFNGEFTYTFKDLSANEIGYQFRWHAMDDDGAWSSTEWQLFILNKQVVQLLILFNGTLENLIDSYNPIVNITIVNLNSTPGNLKLFVDSQLIQQEESFSLTNISQYLNGVYNITAILVDQNYTGYAVQWLNIQETTPPTIIFEFSEVYINTTTPEYYHRIIRINCTVFDSSPLIWVYFCENSSGMFINSSMISVGNGNWNYELDISHLNWNDFFVFYFIANDTWGNIGININHSALYRVKIFDFQEPISLISYIAYINPNIIIDSTSFIINAEDHLGSGISSIKYRIDDSDWIDYINPFNMSNYQSGTYIISYYSIDNAGNIEESKSFTVVLIKEDSTDQRAIPSYNLVIIISVISISLVIIFFKNRRRKYSLIKILE